MNKPQGIFQIIPKTGSGLQFAYCYNDTLGIFRRKLKHTENSYVNLNDYLNSAGLLSNFKLIFIYD